MYSHIGVPAAGETVRVRSQTTTTAQTKARLEAERAGGRRLTVLCVEQHLVELGLVVIKCPPDLVYGLLIGQVTVHEAAKRSRRETESEPSFTERVTSQFDIFTKFFSPQVKWLPCFYFGG